MIKREKYLNYIRPYINAPFVKILSGIRRCGKSSLLELIAEDIINSGINKENIVFLHLDSYSNDNLRDGKQLYNYLKSKVKEPKTYIFIDEVQESNEWEKAVNSLMVDCNVDIYVTGSNSKLLSSEISTYLTGRYISINVFPLSYSEYLLFKKETNQYIDGNDYIDEYIKLGGFPSVSIGKYSPSEAYTIVKDIYNSVIFTDIVQRNLVRKIDLFEKIVKFIFSNIGNTFSSSSIIAFLKSEGRNIDIETLYNYISYLEKAFIIYRVNRYDIQGKQNLKTQEKYYLSDHSLKYSMLGFDSKMVSGVIENIVFIELKRRHYDVYIGKLKDKEIDFVAIKNNKKIYVQVCRNLPESSNRELENLKEINDNYHKYIVTLDKYDESLIDGVEIIYLEKFLLKDEL